MSGTSIIAQIFVPLKAIYIILQFGQTIYYNWETYV